MPNILEIKKLKVDFLFNNQFITAVQEVNLFIREGEVLVLAGESGSGKTITALSITRILPKAAAITSGSIIFNARELTKLDEPGLIAIRGRQIAYIFQEPVAYLNPVYSVGNQITEAIMLHQGKSKKEAEEKARELLELVKLKDAPRVIHNYPHQLSGGMNQRVFIAMALACRPKLLIADEPTTSLDVTVEREILSLLMELKQKMGFSLLFITHNLSIAKRIADRVCVMYKGKTVEEGKCARIFSHPGHFHTQELIGAYNKIGRI
jgi:ABC-type dipeptide/oligopeptide/nickel transport system ATPase component